MLQKQKVKKRMWPTVRCRL